MITKLYKDLTFSFTECKTDLAKTPIFHNKRRFLRVSLPKTGPLRFGSENQFPLNFAHEYILVQK